MRFISKFGFSLVFAVNLASHAWAADVPLEKFASVQVSIDKGSFEKEKAGIHTLFVILYDREASTPRPYGALKVDLKEDAKGTFYTGDLTSGNITTMGEGPLPKKFKIKARLDKDGSAGGDLPGDLVGIVENVAAGEKAKIKISQLIK